MSQILSQMVQMAFCDLQIVAYISQTGHQCFPVCFCHPTVGNFEFSPYLSFSLIYNFTLYMRNLLIICTATHLLHHHLRS